MKFIRCSALDGAPLVGNCLLYEGISLNENVAIACIEGIPPTGAIEIDEIEYLRHLSAGKLSADKHIITADGLDTATITAEVHPDLTEITFYHADTGEPIATVPVDPATHIATLQVTATTPGVIRIRAGEPTVTRLNEVIIHAVEAS